MRDETGGFTGFTRFRYAGGPSRGAAELVGGLGQCLCQCLGPAQQSSGFHGCSVFSNGTALMVSSVAGFQALLFGGGRNRLGPKPQTEEVRNAGSWMFLMSKVENSSVCGRLFAWGLVTQTQHVLFGIRSSWRGRLVHRLRWVSFVFPESNLMLDHIYGA